ncbi:hypothetical protein P175DRAFT_0478340, partial [Aspergillus ochraceoroseus IBT 24754]
MSSINTPIPGSRTKTYKQSSSSSPGVMGVFEVLGLFMYLLPPAPFAFFPPILPLLST